jgi:hypothetical protein
MWEAQDGLSGVAKPIDAMACFALRRTSRSTHPALAWFGWINPVLIYAMLPARIPAQGRFFWPALFLFIGCHMIPLKYLHTLRAIAIAAFAAGAIWLAEWHHTDATVVDALAVIIPFIVVTFTNVMIKRDK